MSTLGYPDEANTADTANSGSTTDAIQQRERDQYLTLLEKRRTNKTSRKPAIIIGLAAKVEWLAVGLYTYNATWSPPTGATITITVLGAVLGVVLGCWTFLKWEIIVATRKREIADAEADRIGRYQYQRVQQEANCIKRALDDAAAFDALARGQQAINGMMAGGNVRQFPNGRH